MSTPTWIAAIVVKHIWKKRWAGGLKWRTCEGWFFLGIIPCYIREIGGHDI